jgi:hypothetical protein
MTHQPSQDQDLRTALEPFADLISTIEKEAADSRIFTIAGFGPSRKAITVGHIRRAHAALTPAQAPDKAGEREGVSRDREQRALTILRRMCADERLVLEQCEQETAFWKSALRMADEDLAPQPNGTEASRGVIPAGWKLVPEEPTEAMLDAYWHQAGESREMRARCHDTAFGRYRAMIAATPTPPLSPDSTGPAETIPQHWKVIEETGASVAAAVVRRLTPIIEEEIDRYWPEGAAALTPPLTSYSTGPAGDEYRVGRKVRRNVYRGDQHQPRARPSGLLRC